MYVQHPPVLLILRRGLTRTADFSFGKPLGALGAWESGADMSMVAKNDEKATWMPLVGETVATGKARLTVSTADEFPRLVRGMDVV